MISLTNRPGLANPTADIAGGSQTSPILGRSRIDTCKLDAQAVCNKHDVGSLIILWQLGCTNRSPFGDGLLRSLKSVLSTRFCIFEMYLRQVVFWQGQNRRLSAGCLLYATMQRQSHPFWAENTPVTALESLSHSAAVSRSHLKSGPGCSDNRKIGGLEHGDLSVQTIQLRHQSNCGYWG